MATRDDTNTTGRPLTAVEHDAQRRLTDEEYRTLSPDEQQAVDTARNVRLLEALTGLQGNFRDWGALEIQQLRRIRALEAAVRSLTARVRALEARGVSESD